MFTFARSVGFSLFTAVVFLATPGHAAEFAGPASAANEKAESVQKDSTLRPEPLRLNTTIREDYVLNPKQQRVRNAGIALSVVGGVSAITGAVFVVIAASNDCERYDDSENTDAGMAAMACAMGAGAEALIGLTFMGAGMVLGIPGLVMANVGHPKMESKSHRDTVKIDRKPGVFRWHGVSVLVSPSENKVRGLATSFTF
jgi:hypothetical protein